MIKNKRAWESKIKVSLWANRVKIKKSTDKSPFELVYRVDARFLVKKLLPIYMFIQKYDDDIFNPMQDMIMQLIELDENRRMLKRRTYGCNNKVNIYLVILDSIFPC